MSRVLISASTGAIIYVFSDDHCPPHVHARQRGDGWIARVRFSYVSGAVVLMSIAPLKNIPLQRVVNRLLDDLRDALPSCRKSWWMTKQTTCLANQWALVLAPEKVELHSEPMMNAKQIADASCDPDKERLLVAFRDGTTLDVSTRP
jgi:hypothetical protein